MSRTDVFVESFVLDVHRADGLLSRDLLASGKRYCDRFSTNRFETCRAVYAGFCML